MTAVPFEIATSIGDYCYYLPNINSVFQPELRGQFKRVLLRSYLEKFREHKKG
jgi:hypothetical protein